MAKWKSLGYVVDSDEEDESQISEHVENSNKIDGSRKSENTDKVNDGNFRPQQNQEESYELANRGKEAENKEQGVILNSGLGLAQPARTSPAKTAFSSLQRVSSVDDVDELQQDHYDLAGTRSLNPGRTYDTRVIRTSLATAPLSDASCLDEPPSSPLSEPPSILDSPSVRDAELQSPFTKYAELASPLSENDRELRTGFAILDENMGNEISRRLRRRNPIQVHPYAIESEKYRQILKARGLKPLRIAQADDEILNAHDEDTQDFACGAEDTNGFSQKSGVDSTKIISSSPQTDGTMSKSPSPVDSHYLHNEQDLPDVSELLRTRPSYFTVDKDENRKLARTSSSRRMGKPLTQGTATPSGTAENFLLANNHPVYVPPSPPGSGGSINQAPIQEDHQNFRFPRGFTPMKLPTPLVSSETRHVSPARVAGSPTSSNSETSESSDNNSSEDSSSESETGQQIEHVQRKIRGVLPASWLKLDLKLQRTERTSKVASRSGVSPEKTGMRRGVARRVTPLTSPTSPSIRKHALVVSDDETADSSLQDVRDQHIPIESARGDINTSDSRSENFPDLSEAWEDNQIDQMLPPAEHVKHHPRKRVRNYFKLPSKKRMKSDSVLTRSFKISRSKPKAQSKTNKSFHRSYEEHEASTFPSALSLLDTIQNENRLPRFLKIAARTARLRHDKGRHTPSYKYFRLSTADDTNDAVETLQKWQKGTMSLPKSLAGTAGSRVLPRQPLSMRSENSRIPREPTSLLRNVQKENRPINAPRRGYTSLPNTKQQYQYSLDRLSFPHAESGLQDVNNLEGMISLKKRNIKVLKSAQTLIPLQSAGKVRQATLETPQASSLQKHLFRSIKHNITSPKRNSNLGNRRNILLDRFIEREPGMPSKLIQARSASLNQINHNHTTTSAVRESFLHRTRKRSPVRVDTDNLRFHQDTTLNTSLRIEALKTSEKGQKIIGLGRFETQYTHTFDIQPLPAGTYLHSGGLIGSGIFRRSLRFANQERTHDISQSFTRLEHGPDVFSWGPWSDTVSAQFGLLFEAISFSLQTSSAHNKLTLHNQALSSLQSIIRYLSDHLSFLDPVDRNSCISRCKRLLRTLLVEFDTQDMQYATKEKDFRLQVCTAALVISNQLHQIAEHEVVSQTTKADLFSLTIALAQTCLHLVSEEGFQTLSQCLNNLKPIESCEFGIQENLASLEAVIIAHYIVRGITQSSEKFWDIVGRVFGMNSSSNFVFVGAVEENWQKLFIILPFLEFDEEGIIRSGLRFTSSTDGWPLVKQLLSPTLSACLEKSKNQNASVNSYCRALFGRCLHLINRWGWGSCQLILWTLFDFFAHNSLAHLNNEDSHGSPDFLQDLDKRPLLQAVPRDRCFHLFLKIIGCGLHHMRNVYSEKKIRDIVWRLVPNHGRLHPKEEAISRVDLDALQNHHDLLSILYWAAPPVARPRLSVIRNLVRLDSSHRETCHIHIRTWFNLVKFQLSTGEGISSLEPFSEWFNDILDRVLNLYNHATSEADEQAQLAKSKGLYISDVLLETTISRNQKQVVAILDDALVSLGLGMNAARDENIAGPLLVNTLVRVFNLFDTKRSQVHKSIIKSLDVILAFIDKLIFRLTESSIGVNNDDSQDYGDWTAFDSGNALDTCSLSQSNSLPARRLLQNFHEPLKELLSNCFGADAAPDDALLLKLTEVWANFAQCLVHKSLKRWDDYIPLFGHDSWLSLRETEQKRKFTAYFLALLLEKDKMVFYEHREVFMVSWLDCIVERESRLRFQHYLTTKLLCTEPENPLFENLPFYKDMNTNCYNITASEFLERRLSLLSCILHNMRQSYESTILENSNRSSALKQEYAAMIKHLMAALKRNYQDLGPFTNPISQGTYVSFVHKIISFLQQHTTVFCSIDSFFTNGKEFPLPSKDPAYIISRFRSYEARVHNSSTLKQLATFLQSVTERAVEDGREKDLSRQLYAAMTEDHHDSSTGSFKLKELLMKEIFPAYLKVAFTMPCGWLIASPILQAQTQVFANTLHVSNIAKEESVAGITSMLTAFLESAKEIFEVLFGDPDAIDGSLNQPHIVRSLSLVYENIAALLPTLDYSTRLHTSINASPTFQLIESFKSLAFLILSHLSRCDLPSQQEAFLPTGPLPAPVDQPASTIIRAWALRELQQSLERKWTYDRTTGRYFVLLGSNKSKEIPSPLSRHSLPADPMAALATAKECLLRDLLVFNTVAQRMPAFMDDDADERSTVNRSIDNGLEDDDEDDSVFLLI